MLAPIHRTQRVQCLRDMPTDHAYRFGPFNLLPAQRSLLEDGRAVRLGSRAFDLLLVLAQRRERLVSKQELLDLKAQYAKRYMRRVEDGDTDIELSRYVPQLKKMLEAHLRGKVENDAFPYTKEVSAEEKEQQVKETTRSLRSTKAGCAPKHRVQSAQCL